MQRKLIIGTRGSPLALYQAHWVQKELAKLTEREIIVKTFVTTGDRLKGELRDFGGKGLFTKELEQALLEGDIDMAVHSMKDVPTLGQDGLEIGAIMPREDPRDAFISQKGEGLMHLPPGAVIGTASLRRRAQISRLRPDIKFNLLRGNVETRLQKLSDGKCDGTCLAYAGLKRLSQAHVITEILPIDVILPAPAQGAVGVEIRAADKDIGEIISGLDHDKTHISVIAERAFLRALDGSCRTPIAALAVWEGEGLIFKGEIFSPDGNTHYERGAEINMPASLHKTDRLALAKKRGADMGHDILKEAGGRFAWSDGAAF